MTPISHPCMGVVLTEKTKQHGHGMEQFIEFGDSRQAISIFVDDQDFIHNA
jgi:hypothetical protein